MRTWSQQRDAAPDLLQLRLQARRGAVPWLAIPSIIELGSGTSEKTRLLLDAAIAGGRLDRFVPFDVSEEVPEEAADRLRRAYPGFASTRR